MKKPMKYLWKREGAGQDEVLEVPGVPSLFHPLLCGPPDRPCAVQNQLTSSTGGLPSVYSSSRSCSARSGYWATLRQGGPMEYLGAGPRNTCISL